ncbi:hypothetical protein RN001_005967 [Aquatica leii]|uniref:DUF4806 domain-containing protein n=1 Tax=Aquatica leii TaxID=1421715 RepID=A0AAN7QKP2_9COLE|nr:hypothetical protein RN001_005967 [Aquatica leii]
MTDTKITAAQKENLLSFMEDHSYFAKDKLPINNLSEIDEIEDLIKNEEIFNELVHFLYLVGGENYVRMVNSVMKKLLRHEVAVKFSGVGKKCPSAI